jgi:hypothetical protein
VLDLAGSAIVEEAVQHIFGIDLPPLSLFPFKGAILCQAIAQLVHAALIYSLKAFKHERSL